MIDNATLIEQLAIRGVRHLRAATAGDGSSELSDEALIVELAAHPDPRFREALIALFLRHPEYAPAVHRLAASEDSPTETVLQHMYTAAVYLQRLWKGTLGLYLGEMAWLPDYFGSATYGLPPPEEHFGEAGLRALADLFRQTTGMEWLSAYQSAAAHLLTSLRLESSHGAHTA